MVIDYELKKRSWMA